MAWFNIGWSGLGTFLGAGNTSSATWKLYTKTEDNTYSEVTHLAIPESISTLPSYMFGYCSSLQQVTIPKTFEKLASYTFQNCKNLTTAIIHSPIIESSAFLGCSNISNIFIGKEVSSISANAFTVPTNLKLYIEDIDSWNNIDFQNEKAVPINDTTKLYTLNSAGDYTLLEAVEITNDLKPYVFNNYTYLANVKLNCDSVVDLTTFAGCRNITMITLGEKVKNIDITFFQEFPLLETIEVDIDNLSFTSINGVLYDKDIEVLKQYPANKADSSFNVPDGVLLLDNLSFYGSAYLSSINIPASVRWIRKDAFSGCDNLINIATIAYKHSLGETPWGAINAIVQWA